MQFIEFVKQGLKIFRRALNEHKEANINVIFNAERLSKRVMSSVATGKWSKQKQGISHQMKTNNEAIVVAQARRLSSSLSNNDGKHIYQRMLKADCLNGICPASTPESELCGLVNVMACFSEVTIESDAISLISVVLNHFKDIIIPFPTTQKWQHLYKLFDPHGRLVGFITDKNEAVQRFVQLRRGLSIDYTATFYVDQDLKEFRIFCHKGRLVYPQIVVDNMDKLPEVIEKYRGGELLGALLEHGCVEYTSVSESTELKVALSFSDIFKRKVHHMNIMDVSFAGVVAAMAVFFRFNQGPRLSYWIGMAKQRIEDTINSDKGAATVHKLWYGHKPLVNTRFTMNRNSDQIATGTNAVVSIMCEDYTDEDALLVNLSSVQMGMGISSAIRTYDAQCKINSTDINSGEKFEKPNTRMTFALRTGSYNNLRSDGLPRPGDKVKGGDVIIGKTVCVKKISSSAQVNAPEHVRSSKYKQKRRDKSVQVRMGEEGIVSDVLLTSHGNVQQAKVRVRTTRFPEIGDKFSSRHSQKGTIGAFIRPEDAPVSLLTGMSPDIIMTATGFPSRMTMGKQIEGLLGKAVCLSGNKEDGIDHQDFDIPGEDIVACAKRILKRHGFSPSGKEKMMCGRTGKIIDAHIMTGVINYAKLQHMVSMKVHARSTGPVHMLTRQPNTGRSQNGGLRFGPMEVGCTISHGSSEIVRERTTTTSDKFDMYACKKCGYFAVGNSETNYYMCRYCRTGKHVRKITIPYTSKLMTHELNATGISLKFKLRDVGEERRISC